MKKTVKKLALHKETLKTLNQPEELLGHIRGGEGEEPFVDDNNTRRRTLCLGSCDCSYT